MLKSHEDATDFIVLRRYLNCFDQEDQRLIDDLKEHYIRYNEQNRLGSNKYLFRKPSFETPYNEDENFDGIRKNTRVAQYWQDEILDSLLFQGKIKNGFFIEAGAWDFTNSSNSLWYELKHNWTGLLIEPVPEMCHKGYG